MFVLSSLALSVPFKKKKKWVILELLKQSSIPQKAQCFKNKPAGDSFLQRSGILISEAFVSGNSVKLFSICLVAIVLELFTAALLLANKGWACSVTFQQGTERAGEGGGGCRVSPSSTGNVNYPKEPLLMLDCASLTV